jgi:fibronectin-binding autotransporter adhesin
MKPSFIFRSIVLGTSLVAAPLAHAAKLYWDGGSIDIGGSGDGASTGTSGTWDTTILNWDFGVVPHVAWNNTNLDTAVFGGAAGSVSLGANITVGGMQFDTSGYTLSNGSNTLSFGTGTNRVVLNGSSLTSTITGAVGGPGNFALASGTANTPATMNTLVMDGTSTGGWTGTTTIGRGTILSLSGDNQALNNTSGITLNGGQITLTNTSATAITNNRINNSAALESFGGTLSILNTAGTSQIYNESIGAVTLKAGFTSFFTPTNVSVGVNTQTITLDSLARSSGSYGVVAFGGSGTINTNYFFKVTNDSAATAANKIIGPWAIVGNSTTQGDWAIYNSSGAIAARNRAASLESTWNTVWVDTANVHNSTAGTVSLTATRSLNTLRLTGGSTPVINLGNFNLETFGVLVGGSVNTTISTAGSGFLTIPNLSNAAGELYLIGGNRALTVSAPIQDNGASVLTLVASAGHNSNSVTLSGNNSHTGGTVISSATTRSGANSDPGTVLIGHANALGANTNLLQVDSGTLNLKGFSVTVGKLNGYNGTITSDVAGSIFTIGNGNATGGDFQGNITGTTSMALVKTGNGIQTLSGINTYTGATTVSAGVLAVNGSLANTSTTVQSTGTLRGSGSIAGSVTIQNGGTIAAGNSIESLTTGALSLEAGSIFAYEMNNNLAASVAGDLTAVTGNLTLDLTNLANLALAELGAGSWTVGEKLTLISYSGSWNGGLFNYGGTLADDSSIAFSGMNWLFNYNDTVAGGNFTSDLTGTNFVTMTATSVIPEPRAALLGGLGLLMLLRRRR